MTRSPTLAASTEADFREETLKKEFPALQQDIHGHPLVYLDNAATTQKPRAVIEAMARFYECDNANVHRGLHELNNRATAAYEGARGELASTIILYHAAQGDFAGDHGLFHKNFGVYESVHRTPWIIKWPGGPENETRFGLVDTLDIAPTFCELAGIEPMSGLPGQTFPQFLDGAEPREWTVCDWESVAAGRSGSWRFGQSGIGSLWRWARRENRKFTITQTMSANCEITGARRR